MPTKIKFALSLILMFAASIAQALLPDARYCKVYYGDIDGDGIEDILFYPDSRYTPIGVNTVFFIDTNKSTPNLMLGNGDGTFKAPTEWNALISLESLALIDAKFADFDGDGINEIFIQGITGTMASLLLTVDVNGQPKIRQQLFEIENQVLNANSATITIGYSNGRAHLIINGDKVIRLSNDGSFEELEALNVPTLPAVNPVPQILGSNQYSVNVQPHGTANIAIPVMLPPGINGHQPNLAFSYDSGAGNGIMGIGWNLAGVPTISRCPKTIAHDGVSLSRIQYTQEDRLCLGGQRLVSTSGIRLEDIDYWQAGNSFSLINDPTTRITSHTDGEQNLYFIATTAQGKKLTFGSDNNNRFTPPGLNTTSTWMLASAEDITLSNGSTYELFYEQDTLRGSWYLDEITYPGVRVSLEYKEGRQDSARQYTAKTYKEERRFLHKIDVLQQSNGGEKPYRQYRLSYDYAPENGLLRLDSVYECGPTQCADPYRISWSDLGGYSTAEQTVPNSTIQGAGDFMSTLSLSWPGTGSKLLTHYRYNNDSRLQVIDLLSEAPASIIDLEKAYSSIVSGDFNNDGYPELLGLSSLLGVWEVITLADDPANPGSLTISAKQVIADLDYQGALHFKFGDPNKAPRPLIADFNHDGKLDLALPDNEGWRLLANTTPGKATAFSFENRNIIADKPAEEYQYAMAANLNGGNETQILWRKDAQWDAVSVGNDFNATPYNSTISLAPTNSIFLDINGDGLYDIADASSGTFLFQLNLGNRFSSIYNTGLSSANYKVTLDSTANGERVTEERHYIKVMDFNRDGLQDLLVRKPTAAKWFALLSNGSGFKPPIDTGIRISNNNANLLQHVFTKITDLDGDGNPEIAQYDTTLSNNTYTYAWSYFQPVVSGTPSTKDAIESIDLFAGETPEDGVAFRPNLLTGLTDQHGGRNIFAYAPLSQYRVYTNAEFDDRTWLDIIFSDDELDELGDDDIELTAPMPAVIAMLRPGGGMGMAHFFGYDTPYYSASGRGFLGVRARAHASIDLGLFSDAADLADGAPNLQDEEGNLIPEALRNYLEPFYGATGTILTWNVELQAFKTEPGLNGRIKTARSHRGDWTVPESLEIMDYVQSLAGMDSESLANTLVNNIIGEKVMEQTNTWEQAKQYGANLVSLTRQVIQRYVPRTGEALSTETVDMSYDQWGNLEQRTSNLTAPAGQSLARTETFAREYDISSWMLGFVTGITVTTQTPEGTHTTQTQISRFPGTRKPGTLVELAGTNAALQSSFVYDSNGNLTSATVSDPATGENRTTSYSNFAFSRHPQTITNAQGHISSQLVSDVAGRITQLTRADGVTTYFQNDELGRTIEETNQSLTGSFITQRSFSRNRANCNGCAGYSITTQGGGQPKETIEFDAIGQPVVEQRQLLDGYDAIVHKRYDGKGHLITETLPNSTEIKRFNYDKMGRPTFVSQPDGLHRTIAWSVSPTTGDSTAIIIEQDKSPHASSATPARTSVQVMDFLGRTKTITDPLGTTISSSYNAMGLPESRQVQGQGQTANYSFTYDAAGRRLTLSDPNVGQTTNSYNAFGELLSSIDNAGHLTTSQYDTLGRLTSRIDDANGTSPTTNQWHYDVIPSSIPGIINNGSSCGAGRLCAVTQTQQDETTYVQQTEYNGVGLPEHQHNHFAGHSFTLDYGYDSKNRLTSVTYPNGVIERQAFNSYQHLYHRGYCIDETDCPGNGYIGTLVEQVNAWNAPESIRYGNQLVTQFSYADHSSRVTGISTGSAFDVQALGYDYDGFGNLVSKTNNRYQVGAQTSLNVTEQFGYDTLGRLITINNDNLYSYDAFGNINTKPGLGGELVYGDSSRVHRVTARQENATTVQNFSYDAAGNLTSDGEMNISYTPFNKPATMSKGELTKTFAYGPNHQRYQQITTRSDGTQVEVLYLAGGSYRETRYIPATGDPGNIKVREDVAVAGAVQVRKSYELVNGVATNTNTRVQYLHQDALGSVSAISDENGNLMEAYSYAPFGSRRSADWINQLPLPEQTLEEIYERLQDDGFTDHEMLDDFGLIHMGGRLYHPKLGRFLSPDPFVQAPKNTQSYNRYAYGINNPLKYTDPTGYMYALGDAALSGVYYQPPAYMLEQQIQNIQLAQLSMNNWNQNSSGYITYNGDIVSNGPTFALKPAPTTPDSYVSNNQGGPTQTVTSTSNTTSSGTSNIGGTAGSQPATVTSVSSTIGGSTSATSGGTSNITTCTSCPQQTDGGASLFVNLESRFMNGVNSFTSAAEEAAYYWIEEDIPVLSPVAASLAILATEDKLGTTLSVLSAGTGAIAAKALFTGRTAGAMANTSTSLGIAGDLYTNNEYFHEKVGIEILTRVLASRVGPLDELGKSIHSGIQQLISTTSGALIGNE